MSVVLITGCRSGIGFETALAFGRRGDRVYATMRDAASGDRLNAISEREGLSIVVDSLDVTDGRAAKAIVDRIVAAEQRIDVLVNNAGVPGVMAAIEEIDEAVGREVMETNFWAPFRLCRAVLPHMRAEGSGVIVNVSTFGVQLGGGARALFFYSVSKHALHQLSLSLQAEIAPTGIRVVDIEPGAFATGIYDASKRAIIEASSPYATMVEEVDRFIAGMIADGADPAIVASAIVTAVADPASPTSVLVGADALAAVAAYRRVQIESWQTEHSAG